MPGIARHGDVGSHGGTISSIISTVKVNGRLVLTIGALYHCPKHGTNPVVGGSPTTRAEDIPVARLGDPCACGAVIASASSDTFADS